MNATAPRFFWSLERVLRQDVVLSLSRLCDPPGTGGQQNLTFCRHPALIRDRGLQGQCNAVLDKYEAKAGFARDWRHRLYAHRDLDHAAGVAAHPLARVSRAAIEAALESARSLMNLLELHCHGGMTAYEYDAHGGGGAGSLLWYLHSGLEADERRRKDGTIWRPRYDGRAT